MPRLPCVMWCGVRSVSPATEAVICRRCRLSPGRLDNITTPIPSADIRLRASARRPGPLAQLTAAAAAAAPPGPRPAASVLRLLTKRRAVQPAEPIAFRRRPPSCLPGGGRWAAAVSHTADNAAPGQIPSAALCTGRRAHGRPPSVCQPHLFCLLTP